MIQKFDINDFDPVIQKHNQNTGKLHQWRKRFSTKTIAAELADFILTYPKSSSTSSYWLRNRSTLEACFENKSPHRGNKSIFNPWDGWWKGDWYSTPDSFIPQYHIWDKTVQSKEKSYQYIQPVTQSTSKFVDHETIDKDINSNTVDLGINVWSEVDGITGWVSKRQSGEQVEMPHIGYSPNAHTLIWITQMGQENKYYMFFEWVEPSTMQYGIHGKTFQFNGDRLIRGKTTGWSTYKLHKKI